MDYADFRSQYVQQHPASVPSEKDYQEMSEYPGWLKYAVLAMFVSAALLSGVHTIPTVYESITPGPMVSEFGRQMVSYLSFVAVELAIFVSAYMITRVGALALFAGLVLTVAAFVATTANLRAVNNALQGSDPITKVVTVALGVGAPLIALMAGKMFITIYKADRLAFGHSQERYKDACLKFDQDVLLAWTKYQRRGGKASIGVHALGDTQRPQLSAHLSSGHVDMDRVDGVHGTGQGYNKNMDSEQVIREWILAQSNTDWQFVPVRKLATRITLETGQSVSKSKVAEVKRMMQGGGQ